MDQTAARTHTDKTETMTEAREASVAKADMKLEAIVIPVLDVGRSKEF